MLQRLKKVLLNLSLLGLLVVPMAVPAVASAADTITNSLSCGAEFNVSSVSSGDATSNCSTSTEDAGAKLNGIIKLVINIFSLIVGVVAVIMIIIGGLKYITSSGDSGNVSGAKNTILYAVVGLVVVALAQFIVRFVLTKTTQAGSTS